MNISEGLGVDGRVDKDDKFGIFKIGFGDRPIFLLTGCIP
jgi:hypothetical protein